MSVVVLGAVEIKKRTHFPGLVAYLASLRHFDPGVRVVFFNWSPEHPELAALLQRFNVESIHAPPYITVNRIRDYGLPSTRFLCYREWLNWNPTRVVLMTDVVDVLWQGGPFAALDRDALTIAAEAKTISDDPYNRRWMREQWPSAVADELMSHPIVCCGVIMGGIMAVQDYLQFYADEVNRRNLEALARGFDTAMLAAYAYRPDSRVAIHPWSNKRLMHLGLVPQLAVSWVGDQIQCLGLAPTIVHQYNRHPEAQAGAELRWT